MALEGALNSRRRALVVPLAVRFAVSLLGLSLFARGFFPVKPLLPGYTPAPPFESDAVHSSELSLDLDSTSTRANPAFSRLAFVVVDALRR
jgi:ethanolaminephosphotransferase